MHIFQIDLLHCWSVAFKIPQPLPRGQLRSAAEFLTSSHPLGCAITERGRISSREGELEKNGTAF